jgi:hypothetical protein
MCALGTTRPKHNTVVVVPVCWTKMSVHFHALAALPPAPNIWTFWRTEKFPTRAIDTRVVCPAIA